MSAFSPNPSWSTDPCRLSVNIGPLYSPLHSITGADSSDLSFRWPETQHSLRRWYNLHSGIKLSSVHSFRLHVITNSSHIAKYAYLVEPSQITSPCYNVCLQQSERATACWNIYVTSSYFVLFLRQQTRCYNRSLWIWDEFVMKHNQEVILVSLVQLDTLQSMISFVFCQWVSHLSCFWRDNVFGFG